MANLLHDVTIGDKFPNEVNCIIEIPKDSHNKYEIDKKTGLIKLDRVNYGPTAYPFNYGFIPQTYWDDGDALDVIILSSSPIYPGILVNVRPVAIMNMTDCGDKDDKIICVPADDMRWNHVKNLKDLNPHFIRECANFFETYKALKNGKNQVTVHGYQDKKVAIDAIKRSRILYKKEFVK